jgi:hypothetical protein
LYLGNPLLPLSLSAKQALIKVETVLREKNWKDFDAGELKLVLIPYYLYNYHFYTRAEKEGEVFVQSSKDGVLALNGTSLKVEEKTVKIITENIGKGEQIAPAIEHEVKKSPLTKSTQEHILKVKTAEFFKLSIDQVVVSNVKTVMFPMYESFITVQGETHEIIVDGVSGNIYGIEEVGEREKGFLEITQETLQDLKDPRAWVEYTKGLAIETRKFLAEKESIPIQNASEVNVAPSASKLSFLSSKWIFVLIIVLALFLIYLAFIA